jgi:hemolysin activation/secretion protein
VDQPYQVALGGEEGVRGYNEEDLPTGTTFVASQEARVNLPWFRPAVGLGLTGFFDVGRGWAEEVPFGMETGWRTAVGGGIRIAFPAGSGTVTRLEIAWPIDAARGDRGPVIRTYWSPVTTRR